jgi:predicted nucleic acid-binding protein
MVLVDTSVWVSHLRDSNAALEELLNEGEVVCHPFIIGELACGNLKNRAEILSLLQALPMALHAEHEEVMRVIETYHLIGKGLGYIDMHLLASAIMTNIPIWTNDRRLSKVSAKLGIGYG